MDYSSSLNSGSLNCIKSAAEQKSYQWLMKWTDRQHSSNDLNIEETQESQNLTKPDVPTLTGFLQAIGFKLLSFERRNDRQTEERDEKENSRAGVLTIAIECGTTNMRASLELDEVPCQCPNPEHVKDASFWSITGTGPVGSMENIAQKVEETGSNLLPRLSKNVTRVVRDVSFRLFEIITTEPDLNRNTERSFNISRPGNRSYEHVPTKETITKDRVIRSHTQPEIRTQAHSLSSKSATGNQAKIANFEPSVNRSASPKCRGKVILQRQTTYDLNTDARSPEDEPRPSPPKVTSPPAVFVELSNSLSQISLQSDIEYPKNLVEYIVGAQQNLEKALNMLSVKNSTVSNATSPNQDQDCASVHSAPGKISPTTVVGSARSARLDTTRSIQASTQLSFVPSRRSFLKEPSTHSGAPIPKTRRSMQVASIDAVPQKSLQSDPRNSKLRRRSFGCPTFSTSNLSLTSRPIGVGAPHKTMSNVELKKTNVTLSLNVSGRPCATKKKQVSPESPRNLYDPPKPVNPQAGVRRSLISARPAMKISTALPVKVKPSVYTTKINTEIAKRTRPNPSLE